MSREDWIKDTKF